jgi:hypothetical protein
MNTIVHCDHVFDRLTRGPFPGQDAGDDKVTAHLAVCHDCRQFAEALRPAAKALSEAYPEAAARVEHLPVYLPEGLDAGPIHRSAWWGIAVCLLALVFGTMSLGGVWGSKAATSSRNSTDGLARLTALNLRNACLPTGMALASGERLRCCTECHGVVSAHRGIDVARLQLACVACHEPPQ